MDVMIFQVMNNLAGKSVITDAIFIFLAQYLIYVVGVIAVILFLLWEKPLKEKIKIAVVAGLTFVVSYGLISLVFHQIWPRLRPFDVLLNVNQLVPESGLSFPSKHATLSFLLATFVFSFDKKIGFWFFVCAILIALGRVFVGVHYPLDILVGAVFGVLMGYVTVFFVNKFKVL